MADVLQRSWSSFSRSIAEAYLKTYGYPSLRSRDLLGEVLQDEAQGKPLSVLDLGCGNGQLYEYLRQTANLFETYVGVDFSTTLLDAARVAMMGDARAQFIEDDVLRLEKIDRRFDIVIYSHVLEMLTSPEDSLRRAAELADRIAIRFFEPPEFETLTIELREMEVGDGKTVPYLRWKMSRDYYQLILAKIGCKRVDVYQANGDKDQIHLLRLR